MDRHNIAQHLEQQEHLLFGMTGRQTMIVGAGVAIGYTVYTQIVAVTTGLGMVLLAIVAGTLVAGCFVAAAFLHIAHRALEQWLILACIYLTCPHRYCWQPADAEEDDQPEEVYIPSEGTGRPHTTTRQEETVVW